MNRSTFMITIIISGVFIISFGSVMAVIMGLVITDSTILGGLLSFAGGAIGVVGAYLIAQNQIKKELKIKEDELAEANRIREQEKEPIFIIKNKSVEIKYSTFQSLFESCIKKSSLGFQLDEDRFLQEMDKYLKLQYINLGDIATNVHLSYQVENVDSVDKTIKNIKSEERSYFLNLNKVIGNKATLKIKLKEVNRIPQNLVDNKFNTKKELLKEYQMKFEEGSINYPIAFLLTTHYIFTNVQYIEDRKCKVVELLPKLNLSFCYTSPTDNNIREQKFCLMFKEPLGVRSPKDFHMKLVVEKIT